MNSRVRERLAVLSVLALTLVSRLPFLGAGFGYDSDAWRVAVAAREAHERGIYVSSRAPGHPVQEILNGGLIRWGAVGVNAGSALASLLAVFLFYRIARYFRVPQAALLSLAFAFVPLVYIQSVQALDYLLALALVLAGIDSYLRGRFVLAGLALGLATGCRITSIGMVLPLFIASHPQTRWRGALLTSVTAVLTAAICFVPVVQKYGFGYLTFYHTAYPPLAFILKELTLDVFGILGLLGLAIAVIAQFAARPGGAVDRSAPRSKQLMALAGSATILYLIAFLRLPDDAAYMLPALPLLLMLVASRLGVWPRVALCVLMMASPFALKIRDSRRIGGVAASGARFPLARGYVLDIAGPIFADHQRRTSEQRFAETVLESVRALPPGPLVVAGDWYPMLAYKAGSSSPVLSRMIQCPKREQLEAAKAGRLELYFLPDVDRECLAGSGIRLSTIHGRTLPITHPAASH